MRSVRVLGDEIPVRSAVSGPQNSQPVIRVRRAVGFSRSHKHHALRDVRGRARRLYCNRANCERHLVVGQGSPVDGGGIETQRARIARFPNTSISTADENGIARRIIRVDRNRCRSTRNPPIVLYSNATCVREKRQRPERGPTAAQCHGRCKSRTLYPRIEFLLYGLPSQVGHSLQAPSIHLPPLARRWMWACTRSCGCILL